MPPVAEASTHCSSCILTFFYYACLPDAPGTSAHILHGYHGDDPWVPPPRRPAYPRVQRSAAPSMLGNIERTAHSALLPTSSREFEKEEPA